MINNLNPQLEHERPSEDTIYEWFKEAHNGMIGHVGCSSSTVQRIRAKGHSWKRMQHDIHRLIRQCAYCQKTDQRQIRNLVQPKVTSNAMVPMERLNWRTTIFWRTKQLQAYIGCIGHIHKMGRIISITLDNRCCRGS
jgi:hypothetical protein